MGSKKTAASNKPGSSDHVGLPKRIGRPTASKTAAGDRPSSTGQAVMPRGASNYRGVKTAAAGSPEPAMPKMNRHRMAGSTSDGEYITSHHRKFNKRG